MHKKIYFGPKPLFLGTGLTEEIQSYADSAGTLVLHEFTTEGVKQAINFLEEPGSQAAIILHNDLNELLQAVKKEFTLVLAAGGLVYTEPEAELLLIFRRGKWDLPKGKLDPDEALDVCAVREVEEETGLQQVTLRQPLCITYHTYHEKNQFILKESHWYLMTTPKEQVLTPQTEEDIDRCEWVTFQNITPFLDNTHPSIIDVIREGMKKLHKQKPA